MDARPQKKKPEVPKVDFRLARHLPLAKMKPLTLRVRISDGLPRPSLISASKIDNYFSDYHLELGHEMAVDAEQLVVDHEGELRHHRRGIGHRVENVDVGGRHVASAGRLG